ncbi:unnamed protein product [Blepharisma stoltei]|uniref:Prohibitin n=1 Tax=Blepharisma stoltei TaxID=1481888 RepID=A0AAU9IG79_9CILI|nr:unnamed protein product [Blepharisma stoltei]
MLGLKALKQVHRVSLIFIINLIVNMSKFSFRKLFVYGSSLLFGFFVIKYAFHLIKTEKVITIFDTVPFIQFPITLKIAPKALNFAFKIKTSDLHSAAIKQRIIYRPNANDLPKIYLNFGLDYGSDYGKIILSTLCEEVSKLLIEQSSAQEISIKKEEISQQIKSKITLEAQKYFLIIDDAITQIDI